MVRMSCHIRLSFILHAAMKAVVSRCEGASGQGSWERGEQCARQPLCFAAIMRALAAMPPLVQLSPESKALCFKELDSLRFSMDGLYPQP
jgi:hypothetical protein